MNISQHELMSHPLMAKVVADLAETKAQQQMQRANDHAEAQRVRAEQGQRAVAEYKAAMAEYERMRHDLHAVVGRVWAAVQAYQQLTHQQPSDFTEAVFSEINVPTLVPCTSPWGNPFAALSTTKAAIEGYRATMGKTWPAA